MAIYGPVCHSQNSIEGESYSYNQNIKNIIEGESVTPITKKAKIL
jgi:hypothetical protein